MKLMTARQIAKKYHRTMSGVYLIIRREKLEPAERRGNCNFYDAKEVARLVTSNDTAPKDGEISTRELMRLHGLNRNALHSILLTKQVEPIRRLDGYRGLVFYNKVEAGLAIEDNKNNAAKLAEHRTGKKLLTTHDLCALIGLSSNNAFSWAKNRDIKSISVPGCKFALFDYNEIMPHIEKYNADKKRLEEIKDSAELITRNQIAARFKISRQRVSQIIIKHNIKPAENLRVRQDARLFYRTSEIQRYFGANNLDDNEITAKGLSEWFNKGSSAIFYAIRRMNLKPIAKVRYGAAVYDRTDAIKKIHKYFKAREARQDAGLIFNPKSLEVRTQKNSDTTTFEMGIEFDQCYNAISIVLKKCKVAPIARKAGSNAFLYDRKQAVEVLTGFYENENFLDDLLAKAD